MILKIIHNLKIWNGLFQIAPALQIYDPIVQSNFPQIVMKIQSRVNDQKLTKAKVNFHLDIAH